MANKTKNKTMSMFQNCWFCLGKLPSENLLQNMNIKQESAALGTLVSSMVTSLTVL